MKNIFVFVLSFCLIQANAQTTDPQLTKRLNEYMQLNRDLKFAELMEYIHPALFTLAPKEAMIEVFEKGFNNDDIRITIDSISLQKVYPQVSHNNALYHKVDYFMAISMELKDKSMFEDSTFGNLMIDQLASGFPGKKIRFDPKTSLFHVSGNDPLIAIKENDKALWMFLGYDRSKAEIFATLLPEGLIEKLGLDK